MNNKLFPVLVLIGGAALFLTGVWFGRQGASSSTAGPQRSVLYYVDPMNPAHTSDQPGLAPCGMKMVPVYASADTPPGVMPEARPVPPGGVRISAQKQQLIGIQCAAVTKTRVSHTVRLFGRVVPDDRRVYRLNSGVDGIIREVSSVTEGSQVKKDQWLATFSAPDARTLIQGFLTAVDVLERHVKSGPDSPAALGIVADNVRLASDRLQTLGLSTNQIAEIRTQREVPAALRIHAPSDGILLARNVTPGLNFEKGTEWYRIADLGRVWVLADVHPRDADYFRPGTMAQVFLPGQRRSLPARLSDTLPQFDPVTGTLKVRFDVDNPDTVLKPEMFVDVIVSVELGPMLAVPVDAVLELGLRATVFVASGDGVFTPRVVETGRRLSGQVEIVSGLEPGEQIVTAGNFLLDSESRIRLAASGARDEAREAGHKDPVCGMGVDEEQARAANRFSHYESRTYYFCSMACKQSFEQNSTSVAQKAGLPHPKR